MGSAGPRAVVLADSDSRWKWAASVARRVAPDHALDAYFVRTRTTPTPRQIAEVGIEPDHSRFIDCHELVDDPRPADADVLIFGVAAGTTLSLLHSLGIAWRGRRHRPVTVSGYYGVVYEKMVDGLLLRAGCDLVIANSAFDAERFRDIYAGIGADPDSVVEAGLPFLGGARYDPSPVGRERPFTVCFAVQPTVPAGETARSGLLQRLDRHARRYPDREVLLKLRNQPGEAVTHIERHSYQALYDAMPAPAPNLRLVHGDMGSVLDRTDLLVTVSSTAAMEALHRGIPTAILSDYGVREALGNHYFLQSGCLASWADLDAGTVPTADPGWAALHGVGRDHTFGAVRERLAALRAAGPLPPLRPYYTPERGGSYLEQLLAPRGLGLDGRPAAVRPPAHLRPVRRMVQRGAGGLYRVGRHRVAPVIRRLAQG
ncbi:hypothetical protein PJ985_06555 [Streptomyces sp. ACA25]|uniref:DUF6716 putative glycosyltransferase n=1 Tax=Streptomyces sp. ACA25 TaxID=3022596 RepID=UPI002307DE46|nr:DUF6716 putative glycosyltransferase [Streptomyces sp. ACA25]MDB1087228.1 hypothetical protein [Streptomyces sp. ACA25]